MSDLRNNLGLTSVSTTLSGATVLAGGGRWARAFGRINPCQTDGQTVLGQVVENLYSVDDLGIAYPSGTLWVRFQQKYSGSGDGSDDYIYYWVAVPPSLPSGFTYNPLRNLRPNAGVSIGAGGHFAVTVDHLDPAGEFHADFAPSYSPALPIRGASGIYTPLSSTTSYAGLTHVYGPHNFNNTTFHYDMSNPSTALDTFYMPLHPGYRNIRIVMKWDAATYAAVGATAGQHISLDGTFYNAAKSDFVLIGGEYVYTIDTGPSIQAAAGVLRQIVYTEQLVNFPAPGRYGGTRTDLYTSPRVDIPLPWSATSGNVHAPGGILTGGNVPGF